MTTISIAICCYNSGSRLPQTLQAIAKYVPSHIPLIVVDDGSQDDTSAVASHFTTRILKHSRNLGYGQARQSAVDACDTDVIAFLDDSCEILPEWWGNLNKQWQNYEKLTAVGGPMIIRGTSVAASYARRNNPFAPSHSQVNGNIGFLARLKEYMYPSLELSSRHVSRCANGNLSIKMNSIVEIGGYDVKLNLGGEDENICNRLIAQYGTKSIFFDSNIRVYQNDKVTISSACRRSYRYGKSLCDAYLRTGGIPTFLPLPSIYLLALFLLYEGFSFPGALIGMAFIPILFAIGDPRSRSFNSRQVLDFHLRVIYEMSNNIGFLSRMFSNLVKKF